MERVTDKVVAADLLDETLCISLITDSTTASCSLVTLTCNCH